MSYTYLYTNPFSASSPLTYETSTTGNYALSQPQEGKTNQGILLFSNSSDNYNKVQIDPGFTLAGGGGLAGRANEDMDGFNGANAIDISGVTITDFFNNGILIGGGGGGGAGRNTVNGYAVGNDGTAKGGGGAGVLISSDTKFLGFNGGNGGSFGGGGEYSSNYLGYPEGLSTSLGQICFGGQGGGAPYLEYGRGNSTGVLNKDTKYSSSISSVCNGNYGGGGGGGGINLGYSSYFKLGDNTPLTGFFGGSGGGGAGGGNGGNGAYGNIGGEAAICSGGGGGSGGGKGGAPTIIDPFLFCGAGGNGGYGINNSGGTIKNLHNYQGYNSGSIIPLYYNGVLPGDLPENYLIVINVSENSIIQYGQIYFPPGTKGPSTFTFSICPLSIITFDKAIRLRGVLVGITLDGNTQTYGSWTPSGGTTPICNWFLQEAIYINPNSPFNALYGYDLIITPITLTGYNTNKEDLATILNPIITNP